MKGQTAMTRAGMNEALRIIAADLEARHPGVRFILEAPADITDEPGPELVPSEGPVRTAA